MYQDLLEEYVVKLVDSNSNNSSSIPLLLILGYQESKWDTDSKSSAEDKILALRCVLKNYKDSSDKEIELELKKKNYK